MTPLDQLMRMQALEKAYLSASSRMPSISFPAFVACMQAWDIYPVEVDDEVVGAVLTCGPEIHACIDQGYGRWLNRRVLRETLERVIAEHGYALTSATTDAGRRFVERLGFVEQAPGQFVKVNNHGH